MPICRAVGGGMTMFLFWDMTVGWLLLLSEEEEEEEEEEEGEDTNIPVA